MVYSCCVPVCRSEKYPGCGVLFHGYAVICILFNFFVPMEEVTLPNELWLEIFKRMDRPKLMELRLVCHRFYDLIEHLLNKTPEWETLAREAILYNCVQMTMQRAFPYDQRINITNYDLVFDLNEIQDPVLWRGTYLSYKKWQKVLINPHTKNTVVPTSNFGDISCVRTFDKYIAIASDNGSIASYTIDNINQPFYLANHGNNVIQIEFWYSNGDVLAVSVGDDCALKFWDLQNKIEIATNGFFANSISSGECRHFCIGDMGGILTSYERVGNHISPGPTLNLKLGDDQKIVAHSVNGISMTVMVCEENSTVQFVYCCGEIEDGKLIKLKKQDEIPMNFLPENLGALQRVTMPTFEFCFAIGENCIGWYSYYKRTWYEYKLREVDGCNVRSIALHAQILMFGLEDGSIRLLYVPEFFSDYRIPRTLHRLEYIIRHSTVIEVDTEPIVDLTVLEVDKKPCIVAVTAQKVHLINFF